MWRKAIRTARAAAGRRSGKTAGLRRRDRQVNNRRSWLFSSKPFAGVGVTDAQHEEAEAEGQHDDVQHEFAPMRCDLRAQKGRPSRLSRVERCHPAHRFSRREQWQRYRNLIRARTHRCRPCESRDHSDDVGDEGRHPPSYTLHAARRMGPRFRGDDVAKERLRPSRPPL